MTPRETLKALRLRHGLTQAELADKVGLDRSWLNQMETGKRPIGPVPRAKLAAYFKVSPLELGGDGSEDPPEYRSLDDRLEELAENQAEILENQSAGMASLTTRLEEIASTLALLLEAGRSDPTPKARPG